MTEIKPGNVVHAKNPTGSGFPKDDIRVNAVDGDLFFSVWFENGVYRQQGWFNKRDFYIVQEVQT